MSNNTPPVHVKERMSTASPLDYPIFAVQNETIRLVEIFAAAEFLGSLTPLLEHVATCDEYAEEEMTPDDLQDALTELRYHFNLITAEETEAWLAEHYLSLDDLQAFLEGSLRVAAHAPSPDRVAPFLARTSPEELARLLWRHLMLSDGWAELLLPIIRRFLTECLALNSATFDDSFMGHVLEGYREQHGLVGMTVDAHVASTLFLRDRFTAHLRREALYRQYTEGLASTGNCRRQLAALRPELYRVDYEVAAFQESDVAREAYLCVKLDGATLRTVAEQAGAEHATLNACIEDLPDEIGQPLLSAQPGELLRPLPVEGNFWVLLLNEKHEPTMHDAEVLARLRRHLVDNAFAPHLQRDLTWPRWQLMNIS